MMINLEASWIDITKEVPCCAETKWTSSNNKQQQQQQQPPPRQQQRQRQRQRQQRQQRQRHVDFYKHLQAAHFLIVSFRMAIALHSTMAEVYK